MKAIEFDRFGSVEVLQIRDVAEPTIRPDEVLVRVAATTVNPKDTFVRKGRFAWLVGRKFPKRIGYEFAGTVVRAGAEAAPFKPDDRVWGALDGFAGGGAAELVAARASRTGLCPPDLAFEECAAIPLAAQTALQALRDDGRLLAGQRVCINGGSGGVGSFAIQIAKALGARVTSISSARNADLCRSLGATETVDYAATPVSAIAGPFDVFFDVFGNHSFGRVRHLLARGGTYVTTVPKPGTLLLHVVTRLPFSRRSRLVAIRSRRADLDLLAGMVRAGTLRAVIDRVYPFSEIAAAHAHVETKHSRGKVVVRVA